jgi:phosphatidylglycerophosphatase C|tara:strand:- start:305 stop:892 length:588 start_codon:yes stop_codon:yes gene_type:complete
MKIAFFDFDGTITKDDSTAKFIRYFVGDLLFIKGVIILLPMIIAYKLKIITNNEIKRRLITYFFKGIDIKYFTEKAKEFSLNMIDPLIRKKALDRISWHKSNGDELVIVSASINLWLLPWCEKNKISLIATELEIINNKITGNLISTNCFGPEKVKRILKSYDLLNYDCIYAYGNSRGDHEMLELATEKFYKPFR